MCKEGRERERWKEREREERGEENVRAPMWQNI